MALTLIGGGSRSGKSRHALELARAFPGGKLFVATAEPSDAEMVDRIARHRAERGPEFRTVEEPVEIARVIQEDGAAVAVVDCLTLWCSNLMFRGRDIAAETQRLLDAAAGRNVILVTNEVGCGIVPDNQLARQFRDQAGWMNQRCALAADSVVWMAFGIPMRAK